VTDVLKKSESDNIVEFSSVDEIVADLRIGKMVIIVDDEERENEGDLLMAADKVTPEDINFMAK
jgi:3,4-dihydroxy-2-butanone 4-phosphate synthase